MAKALPLKEAGRLQDLIRQLIFNHSQQSLQIPTVKVLAETLHMSPRTLHRKLRKEGTCYRELIKSIRRDFVVERLRDVSVPVSDIAFDIGFEKCATLSTVFKKWTGMSPSAFRKELIIKKDHSRLSVS